MPLPAPGSGPAPARRGGRAAASRRKVSSRRTAAAAVGCRRKLNFRPSSVAWVFTPDPSLTRVRARWYASRNCASVAYGIAPLLLLLFCRWSPAAGRRRSTGVGSRPAKWRPRLSNSGALVPLVPLVFKSDRGWFRGQVANGSHMGGCEDRLLRKLAGNGLSEVVSTSLHFPEE